MYILLLENYFIEKFKYTKKIRLLQRKKTYKINTFLDPFEKIRSLVL